MDFCVLYIIYLKVYVGLKSSSSPTKVSFLALTGFPPTLAKTHPGSGVLILQGSLKQGMPEDSSDVSIGSLAVSSLKQYNTYLENWWIFCQENKFDPLERSPGNILRCLSKYFKDGASYQSLSDFIVNGTRNRYKRINI